MTTQVRSTDCTDCLHVAICSKKNTIVELENKTIKHMKELGLNDSTDFSVDCQYYLPTKKSADAPTSTDEETTNH